MQFFFFEIPKYGMYNEIKYIKNVILTKCKIQLLQSIIL